MGDLSRQANNKKVIINFNSQTYTFNNPYKYNAQYLQFVLAKKIYNDISRYDGAPWEIDF